MADITLLTSRESRMMIDLSYLHHRRRSVGAAVGFSILLILCTALSVTAQNTIPPDVAKLMEESQMQEVEVERGRIVLNFPENVPLKTLIAYVSSRLKMNILYDDNQINHPITLKTPSPIPLNSLLELLETVLKSKNLTMQDTGIPGLKQIVPSQNLAQGAGLKLPEEQMPRVGGVTQVFALENVRAEQANSMIQAFLTRPGGSSVVLTGGRFLVVTDFPDNLDKISRLISLIDTSQDQTIIEPIQVYHSDAAELLKLVQPLLKAEGKTPDQQQLFITSDPRTNTLIVAGVRNDINRVQEVVASLDVPRKVKQVVYRPQVISPSRLNSLIKKVLDPQEIKRDYRGADDKTSGTLVVTATESIHAQVEALIAEVDQLPHRKPNPVRFYKLINTVAEDVLETLKSLEGKSGLSSVLFGSDEFADSGGGEVLFEEDTAAEEGDVADDTGGGDDEEGSGKRKATIAADTYTNSIIVIAPPEQQLIYEQVIRQLDQRRPQVLVETTIVALDTSDDFSLGVEIGDSFSQGGEGKLITFSKFGIGINNNDGSLGIADPAPLGLNVALLSPNMADIVIKALAQDSNTRLVSMPRILVNDNEKGTLKSKAQEPFTVSTISGEFQTTSSETAEAGTEITVEPHISEGDYLQLSYEVELSSFTAEASEGQRPPSQTNSVSSRVTIPDNHTIVVGGLNRTDYRKSVTKIPLLGDIPLLEHLFRSVSEDRQDTTLFIFIKPTILRDDRFRDLKYLSGLDLEKAELPDDFPDSEPILIDVR